MKSLNQISSSQFANELIENVNENFGDVKSAIDTLEQSGGQGSGSGSTTIATPKFINNPFPINNTVLRVLCLGNSYTYTPLMYLSELVDAAGIDKSKFRIELAYTPGMRLNELLTKIDNDANPTNKYLMGGGTLDGSSVTAPNKGIRSMIEARQWDVIVVQAQSDESITYNTFKSYLTEIVKNIRRYCPNQKVCIAWQQTWSKADYATNWVNINNAVKSMLVNNGIDYIIPTGTAIQNARNVSPWSSAGKALMWDSAGHLAAGVARYVGACTWFQSLLAPIFNVSVVGNTAKHDVTNENDYQGAAYGGFEDATGDYASSSIPITNENKLAAQLCAMYAITDMWNVTEISI